jgi:hypothetical protein
VWEFPYGDVRHRFVADRSLGHACYLRALGNRLVGILHGCLVRRVTYSEQLAWPATEAAA